jgi:hypothetical protein
VVGATVDAADIWFFPYRVDAFLFQFHHAICELGFRHKEDGVNRDDGGWGWLHGDFNTYLVDVCGSRGRLYLEDGDMGHGTGQTTGVRENIEWHSEGVPRVVEKDGDQ